MANWIQKAITRKGAFKAKAASSGMTTAQYAAHVLRPESNASELTKQQARLAKTLRKMK